MMGFAELKRNVTGRGLCWFFCGLLLAFATAGCGVQKRGSAHIAIRLAIGGQVQLIYLPATLARDLGYYTDEGLDVTLQDFPGGAKSLESLLGGSSDVVCGFYEHTVQMAAQGRDLRAFVDILRYPGLVAVASAKGINRVEDLKGKNIGISAPGSATQLFLNYLLTKHGLKPADSSTASIGMSATAVGAVTHGTVDAAIMTDPAFHMVLKQMPSIRVLADTRTGSGVREVFGVETYPSAVLYSTGSWIDAHPDATARLTRAMIRTITWMRTHSPEAVRAQMPQEFRTDDEATDLQAIKATQEMLSLDGRLTPESVEAVKAVLSVSLDDVRRGSIDLSKTYTNQFVDRAQ